MKDWVALAADRLGKLTVKLRKGVTGTGGGGGEGGGEGGDGGGGGCGGGGGAGMSKVRYTPGPGCEQRTQSSSACLRSAGVVPIMRMPMSNFQYCPKRHCPDVRKGGQVKLNFKLGRMPG